MDKSKKNPKKTQSRVDKLIDVIHGGLTLRFPRVTVRNEQPSVTANISQHSRRPHVI